MNLENAQLPPTYKRDGKDYYLDPIRRRLIFITPEETVRQKIIFWLIQDLSVPKNILAVEKPLAHYGLVTRDRADIVIDGLDEKEGVSFPVAVIECKAEDVFLGEKECQQVFRYADQLGAIYCAVTNGVRTYSYYYDEEKQAYVPLSDLPAYSEMIRGQYDELSLPPFPPRIPMEKLKETYPLYIETGKIGEKTPPRIAIPLVNFIESYLYPDHKFPARQYKLFRNIEDYGVRMLSYGNASGGSWSGAYRSFLIDFRGNTELVSINVAAAYEETTYLNVAIDDDTTGHHALQYSIDRELGMVGNQLIFYHSGKIGVGKIGAGKIDGLRDLIRREYPEIISGNKFNIGVLTHDRLWNLDDAEECKLVENLISYALLRDEYRKIVKEQHDRTI